jgi:asparagine synthase (glutamine-hydrolysing)
MKKPYCAKQVANRIKQPYRSPDSQAFFADGRPTQVVESLLRPSRIEDVGIFNPTAVSHLVAKCQSGRAIGFADNMAFMAILSTMLIHDLFLSK